MKFLRLLIVPKSPRFELNTINGSTMNFAKRLSLPLLAAILLFATEGLYSHVVITQQTTPAHSEKAVEFYYVCPMHDNVRYKKPGKCPKCKMTLEKRQVKEPTASSDQ